MKRVLSLMAVVAVSAGIAGCGKPPAQVTAPIQAAPQLVSCFQILTCAAYCSDAWHDGDCDPSATGPASCAAIQQGLRTCRIQQVDPSEWR